MTTVVRYFLGRPVEELDRDALLEVVDFLWSEVERERKSHQQTRRILSACLHAVSDTDMDTKDPDPVLRSLEIHPQLQEETTGARA